MRLIFQSIWPGERLVVDDAVHKPGDVFEVSAARGREILEQGDPQIAAAPDPKDREAAREEFLARYKQPASDPEPAKEPKPSAKRARAKRTTPARKARTKPEASSGEGQPTNPEAQGG